LKIENKQNESLLPFTFPDLKVNVDLEDCDKILRVEGQGIVPDKVINFMSITEHSCQMLPN
jgi:phenylalanyl-tRNA synthetase alpha subunit